MSTVPVPVAHQECGEVGADDPLTGKPQCILMRQVTQTGAQASSDTLYDTKENPYETFENPPLPMDRLVFLSYVLFLAILLCLMGIFFTRISPLRKNTLLIFAFTLLLLLTFLQKRDGDV
jgi:hypothetical protein